MDYLGDFAEDSTVPILFATNDGSGGAVAPSSALEAADVAIYKNSSATQKTSTNGVTMTSPFDSTTGLHLLQIDTSNDTGDAGFWATGNDYTVVLTPDETVDSQTVVAVLGQFSIENRTTKPKADFPTNFGTFSIDGSGHVTPNETTGAGNTLLTTNNVNVAAGIVESNAKQLNGNTIQQTGGHIHAFDDAGNALATSSALATVDSNVDTLVSRITSTLFSGITSLADWLRAGFRSDGNAALNTAVTEINNSQGDFDDTADSLEAIRDRGDSAWTTATGFSTHTANNVRDAILSDSTAFKGADIAAILTDTNSLNDTKIPQTLNLTASGNIGIDWANVENPSSIVDLSGTDIQLCDTVTTNSDMRGTDNALLASSAPTNWGSFSIDGSGNVTLADSSLTAAKIAAGALDDKGNWLRPMSTGTAQSGTGVTITLAATETSQNQQYRDQKIEIVGGTGDGQGRIITDYNGSTKVATVDEAWTTNPDGTSVYEISGGKTELARTTHEGATIPTVTDITNAVTVGTNNDKTGYALSSSGLDQIIPSEPGSVPSFGSSTLVVGLSWMIAEAKNKITQTSTTQTLRNEADSADLATASVSDDGTTFSRGAWS